jgi:hypothetical protein
MKKLLLAACAALVVAGGVAGGVAIAQSYAPPQVTSVGTNDLFPDIVAGQARGQTQYATAAAIAGVPGYVNGGAATTAFTYTFGNTQVSYFIQPAGTLATGTLTTAPLPGDGQRECFLSTQTQTALTWTANSTSITQSISGAPTAAVANTPVCMTWNAANATWYRSP